MMNQRKLKPSQISTKSKSTVGTTTTVDQTHKQDNVQALQIHHSKRQGENMQTQDPHQKRRAAFGDLTNAFKDSKIIEKAVKKNKAPAKSENIKPVKGSPKKNKSSKTKKTVSNNVQNQNDEIVSSQESVSSSQESVSSSQESVSSSQESISLSQDSVSSQESLSQMSTSRSSEDVDIDLEEEIDDVDKENVNDMTHVPEYAQEIFKYYKERELLFMVKPYLKQQTSLTTNMRAILVDWLVEVQENFELNHETLYLAVKLVDFYLTIKIVPKEQLQLVGAAALFLSCKFDERLPPLVEDFLYICDDAYDRHEFLEMERCVLRTVGFDLGMPLSYRFLRRFAKCARASMETLTLARFILEMSLMEYELIKYRESQVAAAALLLAFKMNSCGEWTKTLIYHSGYKHEDLMPLVRHLNKMLSSPPNRQLTTIKSKYSHKVFYEVAKIPPLKKEELD